MFRFPQYQAQEMGEQLNNYWILAFLVRCFCKIYKLFKGSYHSWYFPFLPHSAYHRTAKNNCLIKWLIGYLSVCMKNLSLYHSECGSFLRKIIQNYKFWFRNTITKESNEEPWSYLFQSSGSLFQDHDPWFSPLSLCTLNHHQKFWVMMISSLNSQRHGDRIAPSSSLMVLSFNYHRLEYNTQQLFVLLFLYFKNFFLSN